VVFYVPLDPGGEWRPGSSTYAWRNGAVIAAIAGLHRAYDVICDGCQSVWLCLWFNILKNCLAGLWTQRTLIPPVVIPRQDYVKPAGTCRPLCSPYPSNGGNGATITGPVRACSREFLAFGMDDTNAFKAIHRNYHAGPSAAETHFPLPAPCPDTNGSVDLILNGGTSPRYCNGRLPPPRKISAMCCPAVIQWVNDST